MHRQLITRNWGLKLLIIVALVMFIAPSLFTPAIAAPACQVNYTISNQWNTGFTADVKITNNGTEPIAGWTLTWSFANGQQITNPWNATVTQSGASVTASNPASAWNGTIGVGSTASFGFQGNHSGVNAVPTNFAVNGVTCGGAGPTNTPTSTSTRTNTPTITNTPTKTNTPTATSTTPTSTNTPFTPQPGGLKVQYRVGETGASVNQIRAMFNVVNTGSSAVSLSELKLRYWYTIDGVKAQEFHCDYAQVGCGNITGAFQALGTEVPNQADYYYEVSFSSGSLAANGQTGEIQTRINKTDWTNYTQSNDYSFDATKTAFADWTHVTLYRNGALVWGTEPVTGPTNTPTNTPTPTKTNTPTLTPTPCGANCVTPTNTFTPTPTRTNTPTITPTPCTTNCGHLDNPFVGATWYVNPDWAASVNAEADRQGGTLGATMRQVAQNSTFVWLDSIDAVNGTNGYSRSLAGHLDAALAQGANLIGIVIYDLPNRDCSALASNGELLIANGGSARYKTEYIDVIYNVISQPKYAGLRIVAVIEPDSLPNLVTNLSFAKCQEANGPGGYVENTQYTLNRLHPVPNFYAYIDIAHAGWLGWDTNFTPAVNLIANTILGTTAGGNSIDGFISNTANTSVIREPYMTANQSIGGNPVRSADFFQWNQYIDEVTFDAAWKAAMTAKGIKSGMLIDTSRNGWGGCGGGPYVSQQCRPTGPSTSTVLNTFVNASRIDRRPSKGNWCNQNGAGIGERPQVNPPDVDNVYQAFVWVKPPGESDGSSSLIPVGPDNPGGKGFDRMCDPTYEGNSLNNNKNTNALPDAPVSGRWFSAQFVQLVQNAFPPIQ